MAQHIICPFLIYVCAAQSWCQSERHSCPVNQEPCVIGQGWSAGIWFWQGARGTSPPQLGLGPKPEIAAGSRELVERCLDRAQKPNKRLKRGKENIEGPGNRCRAQPRPGVLWMLPATSQSHLSVWWQVQPSPVYEESYLWLAQSKGQHLPVVGILKTLMFLSMRQCSLLEAAD